MKLRNMLVIAIAVLLFFGDLDERPERVIILSALIMSLIVHVYFVVNYIKAYWLMPHLRDHEQLSELGFKLEQSVYVNNKIQCVIIPENGWQVIFNDDVMAEMGTDVFTYTKWRKRSETYVKRNDK